MRKLVLAFFLLPAFSIAVQAQEKKPNKHALLIGIDKYAQPAGVRISGNARSLFTNLDGCVNDARSIHTIITNRFDFPISNVDTLYNEAASRDGILKRMDALYNISEPGDVAFIYYAGHGSQVTNTARKDEKDQKDETMVPADTWKPKVEDIRDKELNKIYNKFIDKGVNLTVIMDCCHSGSISRGPGDPGRFRFIADPGYDVNDPSPTINLEEKTSKFLIMSAAQDNEFAQEQRDENNMPHGAFTLAFIQALNQQSVDASAINLFTAIRAILKSNGRKQEPVLGGSQERQQQTLFGLATGTVPDIFKVAISGINGNKVTLQGGYALGLYKDNELVKFNGKDTLVKVRVDTVIGINKSIATIIKGDVKNLKGGEFLEVTNWVTSGVPVFKIYVPTGITSADQLAKLIAFNKELKASTRVKWVNNLLLSNPYASIFMKGGKFYINVDDSLGIRELKSLSLNTIIDEYKLKDSTVYFELPPSKGMADSIRTKIDANKNLSIVQNMDDAHYVLYGTITQDGKPSYGWRRAQAAAQDTTAVMPVQTLNFVVGDENVPEKLYEYAMRLFKVRGWLQLEGPKVDRSNFPFSFRLINPATKQVVGPEGTKVGDEVLIQIVPDDVVNNPNFNPAVIQKKYLYLFTLNKLGKMNLIHPDPNGGNVENKFPQMDADGKLHGTMEIGPIVAEDPVGTDYIFLLATDEQITTYALLFNQDGVSTTTLRDKDSKEKNPIGQFLDLGKNLTRDFKPKTPSSWVLYKLQAKTYK